MGETPLGGKKPSLDTVTTTVGQHGQALVLPQLAEQKHVQLGTLLIMTVTLKDSQNLSYGLFSCTGRGGG